MGQYSIYILSICNGYYYQTIIDEDIGIESDKPIPLYKICELYDDSLFFGYQRYIKKIKNLISNTKYDKNLEIIDINEHYYFEKSFFQSYKKNYEDILYFIYEYDNLLKITIKYCNICNYGILAKTNKYDINIESCNCEDEDHDEDDCYDDRVDDSIHNYIIESYKNDINCNESYICESSRSHLLCELLRCHKNTLFNKLPIDIIIYINKLL